MNILQVSAAADTGGAGVAMMRLHRALIAQGHQSRIVARLRHSPQPDVLTIPEALGVSPSPVHRFLNNVRMQIDASFAISGVYRSTRQLLQSNLFEQADIVQLHNLHGFYFNYGLLPLITERKPVVWTLHDMWPLTGHCAYAYDCTRWRTGCFDCPLLRGSGRRLVEPRPTLFDHTPRQWRQKRELYQNSQLHVVTPSDWMASQVKQSILADALTIQCIPNGVDLEIFSPKGQASARQAVGVAQDSRVILFVAARIIQGRKGLAYLFQALQSIQSANDLVLLTVGESGASREQLPHFKQLHLGQISDESILSLAYSAADLYVLPTLADNQPLTVLESLASGAPVVCFDVGGLPEMVRHMETGYLARYKESSDLAAGMLAILENDTLRAHMRQNCRAAAVERYRLQDQARRYVDLYEHAISDHKKRIEGTAR
jgi:glycosyltransferase involved in cell wall biosynthesis